MRGTQDTSRVPAWTVGPEVAPVGWALVVGGVCAAIAWVTLLGAPMLFDVRTVVEAAEVGRHLGAMVALLPLPAAGSVLLGLTLLHGGWARVERRLLWLTFGPAAVGAAAAGLWGLAAAAAVALAALLVLRRTSLRR